MTRLSSCYTIFLFTIFHKIEQVYLKGYFISFCFLAALAQCLVVSYSPRNRKWKQNSEQTKISVICESTVCLCESLICQDDIALVSYCIFEGRPRSSMSRHHLQEKATITCSLYYSTRSSTQPQPIHGKTIVWKREKLEAMLREKFRGSLGY